MPNELHGGGFYNEGGLSLAATALELLQSPLLQAMALLLDVRAHGSEPLPAALQAILHAPT